MIPFAEWAPDAPEIGAFCTEAQNVYPRTAGSYGPIGSLVDYSNALDSRCVGAISIRRSDDATVFTFAGDKNKLYELVVDTFTDVSDTGGYALNDEERWEFVQFGTRVIAVGWGEPIQGFDLAISPPTFTQLSASAPQARHAAVVRDFFVVGNTYDTTFGYNPQRVWWAGINDPTSWPVPGTQAAYNAQSDYQDFPDVGSVQAIVGAVGGADGAVVCERAIYRMQYEGAPAIFRFDKVDNSRGTPAPGSVVTTGAFMAYFAEDGFYIFDGQTSRAIGANKVDKWFLATVDSTYYNRITSTVDPINKLIIWSFADGAAGGEPNRLLIWNWQLDRWANAFVDVQFLYRSLSQGYTLEQLDAIAVLDDLPFSLDSRAWVGGRAILGAFSNDNQLSFLTGPSLAATIISQDFESGNMVFVNGVRPIVNGAAPQIAIGWRNFPASDVTYDLPFSMGVDGVCPARRQARYLRAAMTIPAATSSVATHWDHAQGFEPAFKQGGKR